MNTAVHRLPGRRPPAPVAAAFTLIEIMIVVCLMGIIMTMSVPIVYKVWHRQPMAQAIRDVTEVCSTARRLAILTGRETQVIFHPREGRLEVAGGAASPPKNATPADMPPAAAPAASSASGMVAQLSGRVSIQALGINLLDYTDAEIARIHFYPNGTCDEMLMILHSTENEQRGISTEVTTGLASVLNETDLQALRNRLH